MGQTQTKLMRERLWQKMYEAKLRDNYLCQLIAIKRNWLQRWNIFILVVSTSGIMGWKFWDLYPAIACAIVSLLKLIEQHIIPSEKQIEKIDELVDFYCDFYSQLEKIWYAFDKDMITEEEMVAKLHDIEQKERSINKTANEIGKKNNVRCFNKAKQNTDIFFQALLK